MRDAPRAGWEFFETYTRDLSRRDFKRLFTLETPEAYRFFARGIDETELKGQPWHVRAWRRCRAFFMAFTARLSPARRALYGIGLVMALVRDPAAVPWDHGRPRARHPVRAGSAPARARMV